LKAGAGNSTSITGRSGEKGPISDVFIHGWVYDIANGEVRDLGISVGPPGKAIPTPPLDAVAKSASGSVDAHATPRKRCERLCMAKRSLGGLFGKTVG